MVAATGTVDLQASRCTKKKEQRCQATLTMSVVGFVEIGFLVVHRWTRSHRQKRHATTPYTALGTCSTISVAWRIASWPYEDMIAGDASRRAGELGDHMLFSHPCPIMIAQKDIDEPVGHLAGRLAMLRPGNLRWAMGTTTARIGTDKGPHNTVGDGDRAARAVRLSGGGAVSGVEVQYTAGEGR